MAEHEFTELREFAHAQGIETLEAWDIPYYTEKLSQHKYAISQEDLRPYFPEPRALEGLFAILQRLYNLTVREIKDVETWHPDVRFYEISDANTQEVRGQFYLDLYARPHKRGGAWMAECITRKRTAAGVQIPVAYLTCNFSAPLGGDPALFTHDEVITLFHEFGHGLHHMLTRVDYAGVAGINGVAWDAVELPSQFMENWCWEREALDLIAGHYQTGAPLPQAMLDKMLAAKNFQSGLHMIRQLEFSLFDFRLHLEFDPKKGPRVRELLDEVRAEVAVIHPPAFNRFANSFSHIFAGDYGAGYYSYKWAEVLSSDAYAQFEERGIFDRATGQRFLHTILEQGGSREPMELFIEFRGREPTIDALLRHSGIAA
jgi:oligopeptidase A